jgi:peptide/nickel transport system substrate-binding protein
MRRFDLRVGVVALSVAALVVSGCGGGDGDGGDPGSASNEVGPAAADAATPNSGGTLTFALEAESAGGYCLPEAQLAASGIMVHNAIYDPLVAFDRELRPMPWLAESISPNADFTTFTIKLRSGIRFHDGSPLDARVVKLNLDVDRGEPAAVATTGRNPLLSRIVLANVASVDQVDALTLTVTTKVPWPAFPTYLASGRFGVVGEAQLMSPDCADHLIGTGPFQLTSWERNQEMVLDRNPHYWQHDPNGVQLPYLDQLVFRPIETSRGRLDALEAGTVLAAHFSDPVSLDAVEGSELALIEEAPGHREVGHFVVNVGRPPLDDAAVREHLVMAIDRDGLKAVAGGDRLDVADQPYDREVMGYQADIERPNADPEAAAAFFEGKDLSLRFVTGTDPGATAMAEELKRQLEAVGVELVIDANDQSSQINQMLAGTFDLALSRNFPGQDPDSNYSWWYSGQPANFGRMADPEVDAALDEGRSSPDPEVRRVAYERIGDRFAAAHPFLWTWYDAWGIGAADTVHQIGYYRLPDGSEGAGMNWGWSYWTNVWVDAPT